VIRPLRVNIMSTARRLRIGPADQGRVLTWEAFLDAEEEEGCKYELAKGVLEVTSIPRISHRRVTSNLYGLAAEYRREHPGVIDFFGGTSEFRITIPAMRISRHPDLGIASLGAPLETSGDILTGLAAEVVSPSSRKHDYEAKRREYLPYGLREYWIVDPDMLRLTLLSPVETEGEPRWSDRPFEGDEPIVSPMLPGLDAPGSRLWARST